MRAAGELVGIVLAAGRSTRFGGDKLLHALPDGTPMTLASAAALRAVLPRTLAVVGTHNPALTALFAAHGIETTIAEDADSGMGASLAAGIAATADAGGWLVALGDMPYIQRDTVARVADALRAGARLAAPAHQGKRGHPVGFSARFREELLALRGDEGARSILLRHAADLVWLDCGDPGVLVDVDQRAALVPPA